MFKEIIGHYGRCDVLVNNAGIAVSTSYVLLIIDIS